MRTPQRYTDHYAHTVPDVTDLKEWEPLETHLQEVADLAKSFAAAFNADDWGTLAGLWHDLGKYSIAFQSYLRKAGGVDVHRAQRTGKVDHATAGAQHAIEQVKPLGYLLSAVIAGHHSGLLDHEGGEGTLKHRLDKLIEPFGDAPQHILNPEIELGPPSQSFRFDDPDYAGFQIAFFTRMLFSCLVDADFLATEGFMSPDRSAERPTFDNCFPQMQSAIDARLEQLALSAPDGTVTRCRQEILSACRSAASHDPGFYSLTVPTGGGKTLSSLAFALEHARKHDHRRIIYAIPFTSIIEQTAETFRDVFQDLDENVVLEHHSNLAAAEDRESWRSRLSAENWDAPLVVTTNVQLLESLFASRTSRCRKLHNIVNSVIILDEVQTLPVNLLRPCLAALQELVDNYGCTIVLCTATQPAILKRPEFPIGLENVREIIPDPETLSTDMKRVTAKLIGKVSDAELLDRFGEEESFLAIVNSRRHASKLYREFRDQSDSHSDLFHLSTLMCGQHRTKVLQTIRERLANGQPCRVISTQLIEAGVDVDFPVVFRSLAGLDSIAQAAGRCNREGRMESGTVYVFDPTEVSLVGMLKSTAQSAGEIIPDFDDVLDPEAIQRYFKLHYSNEARRHQWDCEPGSNGGSVMKCFPKAPKLDFAFAFRTASRRFRLIDEVGVLVFVPYEAEGKQLIEQLTADFPDRVLLRKLQRYTVTLFEPLFRAMRGDIEMVHDQFPILRTGYDGKLGVRIDRPGYIEKDQYIG